MEVANVPPVQPSESVKSKPAGGKPPPAAQQPREGQAPKSAEAAQAPASQADMDKALTDLAGRTNLKVELGADEESGRPVVRIYTKDGERLLRQMPPEAALKLAADLRSGAGEGFFSSVI